jgi:uncharacterized GH25 family protein
VFAKYLIGVYIGLGAIQAFAHPFWLLPSTTHLKKPGYIALDAGMSEDDMPFQLNHRALKLSDGFSVLAPDGSNVKPENVLQGKLRTTLDLNLSKEGTYRIGQAHAGFVASWKENGKTVREKVTAENFSEKVPANAVELSLIEMVWRLETFVTVGVPGELRPIGKGIELIPVTHINDLRAGQPAVFRFHADGQVLPGLKVEVIREGTRFRVGPEKMELTSDEKGEITVNWPHAGMYMLEATGSDKKPSMKQAEGRTFRYVATFEVLP